MRGNVFTIARLQIKVAILQAEIYLLSALEEIHQGSMAILFFLFPESATRQAERDGIITNFGCWFWIERDGLKVCRRHKKRAFANWL